MLIVGGKVQAQQVPLYASYTVDPFLLSPSFAGTADGLRAFALSRLQFVNIPGAPVTFMGTVDGPFSGQNMGLGGSVYTWQNGLLRNTGLSLAYSYKLNLSDEFKLHLGIALDAAQQSIDFDNVMAQDPTESILQTSNPSRFLVNSTFGAHIEYRNFRMGLSVPQLFETKVVYQNFEDDSEASFEQKRHYNAFLGYTINIKPEVWDFEPTVLMRTATGVQAQFDAIFRVIYKESAFLSAGYRSDYAMTFGGGVNVTPKFLIGYSYDLPTTDIATFTNGSHELVIGYLPFRGGGASGMSRRELNRIVEAKQREEGEKVRALYENDMKELEQKVGKLEEENERQQAEIDSLQKTLESYETEIEEYRKGLEERNRQLLENWQNNGGSGANGGGQGGRTGTGYQGGSVNNNASNQRSGNVGNGTSGVSAPAGRHIVVEASFKSLDRAINYQKLIRRNGDERETHVTRSDDGNWYFVHSTENAYDDRDAAQQALNKIPTDELIPRMKPWIYSRYKTAE